MPIDITNDSTEIALSKLKARENILRKLEELSKLGSWEIDLKTGKSIWSTQSFKLYGLSESDTDPTYKLFLSHVIKEDLKKVQLAVDSGIKTGKATTIKCKIKRTDNAIRTILINGQVIYSNENIPYKIIGTTQDITEIIEAHEKIKEKNEALIKKDKQLFLQSKFAQMGEMLSMIVHQWRQPLSAISSTSANIVLKARSNKLDKETTIKLAERISLYSQHLNSTIDDFRDFFKSDKEKEEITYTKIIQNVLQIVEVSLINKNINLVQILNCEDTFNTYPNELKQVILNIIKNAEDILMERKIKNPTITIETSCGLLTISDNAGGIQEDIINHVFDPYFSTKLEKGGTGIGLYMSKTIIEEHCNGKLSVSNGKEGAIFTIKL